MKNQIRTVKNTLNDYQNSYSNRNKPILFLDELNDERRQNLVNLIKKNPKYQDLYYMIDRKNYFSRDNHIKLVQKVFSERVINSFKDDINSFKENMKIIKKEEKMNNIYKEIDSLQRNSSFEYNVPVYNKQNIIDSLNIKPYYGIPIKTYLNFYDIQNKNKNSNDLLNELKMNLKKNLKKNSSKLSTNKYNYHMSEKGIKRWVKQEKKNLNEPFLKANNGISSNYILYSRNTGLKSNNTISIKTNIKPCYSNDFFELHLENFENNLNKIGKTNLLTETGKKKRKRLLTP